MRTRLHASATALSPERALANLRRIQHHRVTPNSADTIIGGSTVNDKQTSRGQAPGAWSLDGTGRRCTR